MHGNVQEWVNDLYFDGEYRRAGRTVVDPLGMEAPGGLVGGGMAMSYRGGSDFRPLYELRSGARNGWSAQFSPGMGFRVMLPFQAVIELTKSK